MDVGHDDQTGQNARNDRRRKDAHVKSQHNKTTLKHHNHMSEDADDDDCTQLDNVVTRHENDVDDVDVGHDGQTGQNARQDRRQSHGISETQQCNTPSIHVGQIGDDNNMNNETNINNKKQLMTSKKPRKRRNYMKDLKKFMRSREMKKYLKSLDEKDSKWFVVWGSHQKHNFRTVNSDVYSRDEP